MTTTKLGRFSLLVNVAFAIFGRRPASFYVHIEWGKSPSSGHSIHAFMGNEGNLNTQKVRRIKPISSGNL